VGYLARWEATLVGAGKGAVAGAKAGHKKVPILGGLVGGLAGLVGGAIGGFFKGTAKGAKKGAELGFKGPTFEAQSKYAGLGFEGAIGNTGATSGMIGELRTMGKIPGASKKKAVEGKEKSTTYTAGLARNACHFPPESWHSWADSHKKALKLAKEAYEASDTAESFSMLVEAQNEMNLAAAGVFPENEILATQKKAEDAAEESAKKFNEAYLTNGFGDHFLFVFNFFSHR